MHDYADSYPRFPLVHVLQTCLIKKKILVTTLSATPGLGLCWCILESLNGTQLLSVHSIVMSFCV